VSILIDEMSRAWRESGIKDGDTVLLHSSLKRTLKQYLKQKKTITAEMILESFLKAVGPRGTLVLPLFNFEFTTGEPFDYFETPSHMGLLTEVARKYPGAVRTGHPIYSFAVLGYNADEFKSINNYSGYGNDSPFAKIHDLNGKIAVLNLPEQNSMTFYHYIEEMNQVAYRYYKEFSGLYTDAGGVSTNRTYSIYVRDIEKGVVTDVNPVGELLWEKGLYTGDRCNQGNGLRVVEARKLYDFVTEIIQSGRAKGLLYAIKGEVN